MLVSTIPDSNESILTENVFNQVFVLHRISFIGDSTYEYVCTVSSPATEAE